MAVKRVRELTTANLEYQKGSDNNGNPILKKSNTIKLLPTATPTQIRALLVAVADVVNFPATDSLETRLDALISVTE